jgi:hypothetical protein
MSNRRTHEVVGTLAGAGYAIARAPQQRPVEWALEVLGGALGGYVGGRLPDVLDPPSHPGHRSIAHGAVPVGALGGAWHGNLDAWQHWLREQSGRHSGLGARTPDALARLFHALMTFLYQLAASAAAGLAGGYLSPHHARCVNAGGLDRLRVRRAR